MKKHQHVFIACILALGSLVAPIHGATAAQRHPTTLPTSRKLAPQPVRPALWQVDRNGQRIYLFGTVHFLPKGVEWLHGSVAKAYQSSNVLLTEIIEGSPEQMRAIVAQKAMLAGDASLRSTLAPRTRKALEAALASNGLPPATLDRFRPWYAAVALSTLPLMKSGFDPANGVDAKLGALAKERGLRHEALETPEYQLGLFDSLPEPLQRRYLGEVARGAPKIVPELGAMVNAWKRGDAAGLARLMNADESDPKLAETLLIGRNRRWAKEIKARLLSGTAGQTLFVAVGAGHLAGKGSLQEQLKALGVPVKRVQ